MSKKDTALNDTARTAGTPNFLRIKFQDIPAEEFGRPIGRHLIMDGKCTGEASSDRQMLQNAVKKLAEALGVRQLGSMSLNIPGDIGMPKGIGVCAILNTSHISIHSWPKRGQFVMDVYSCKDFDPGIVLGWAKEYLNLSEGSWHMEHWRR